MEKKIKWLKWDRNFLRIRNKSIIKCYILKSANKMQCRFDRFNPYYPDRIIRPDQKY